MTRDRTLALTTVIALITIIVLNTYTLQRSSGLRDMSRPVFIYGEQSHQFGVAK